MQLLSDGKKTKDVAALIGVHRSNLWRWQQRPDFKKYMAKLEQEKEFQTMLEDVRKLRELSALVDSPNGYKANMAANKLLALCDKYMKL